MFNWRNATGLKVLFLLQKSFGKLVQIRVLVTTILIHWQITCMTMLLCPLLLNHTNTAETLLVATQGYMADDTALHCLSGPVQEHILQWSCSYPKPLQEHFNILPWRSHSVAGDYW